VTLVLLVLDQLTKLLVKGFDFSSLGLRVEGMHYGQSIALFGDWLKLTFVENPGMAFSIDLGGKAILPIFSALASVAILVYLHRQHNAPYLFRLSLSLILAGALGNLVDRAFYGLLDGTAPLLYGRVVDFIDVDLFTLSFGARSFKIWPIFNVADAAVSVGVVLLLFSGWPRNANASAEVEVPERQEDGVRGNA
jgi:signal peptidase II